MWQTKHGFGTWKFEKHIFAKICFGTITAALNGEDFLILLPITSWKLYIHQLLPFSVQKTSSIGDKSPEWEFQCSGNHEFYYHLGTWNRKLLWSASQCVRKLMSMRENENHRRIFFQACTNQVTKRKFYKGEGSVTKFSFQRLPSIPDKVTCRLIKAYIGDSFPLISKWPYVKVKIHC